MDKSAIRSTNAVVANALAACRNATRTAGNVSVYDEEILAAYRRGCAKSADAMSRELRRLKAHVLGNKDVHYAQPDSFKRSIDEILDVEMSLDAVRNWH